MLTSEVKSAIKEKLDDLIVLKGIAETIDGIAIGLLLNLADNALFDKINPIYQNIINEILEAIFIDKDYDLAIDKTSILLSDVVKTPLIDGTPQEIEVYHSFLMLLKNVLENILSKDELPE